jgi:ABC-2 type transport system permease protein
MSASSSALDGGGNRQRPIRSILLHQCRYDLRRLWRNPQSRFFTLALPVFLLVIFASVFHGATVRVLGGGGAINESVYYVPGIVAFGVIAAVFMDLTVGLVAARESGITKRRTATPAPAGAVLAGRAAVGVITGLVVVAILVGIGWAAFGASVPARAAPVLLLDVLVGTAAFCCLGFATASLVSSADSAQPVVQAVILPLCFLSGVFIPASELPHWLIDVGNVFPVRSLAAALLAVYNPHTSGSGFRAGDLAVLAAWGALGLVVAWRRAGWMPGRAGLVPRPLRRPHRGRGPRPLSAGRKHLFSATDHG